MAGNDKGKIGCGCLVFVLAACMVAAGVLIHPYSLKLLAGRFHYQDKIVAGDVVFVPRFMEDKHGEVYTEAFKEYWAGDGKAVWVEDDRVFGLSLRDIVVKLAKDRGIKEDVIKPVELQGDESAKAAKLKALSESRGLKKVIVLVPDYASRRYHLLYDSGAAGHVLFLVKPVSVSYFKTDKWWKDDLSRGIMGRELVGTADLWIGRYKSGKKEDGAK